MIWYVKNPNNSKIKLELINKFSKFAGYKINMQKLVVLLYINKKLYTKEIKEKIPFTIAPK